jgi:hypothetical protein
MSLPPLVQLWPHNSRDRLSIQQMAKELLLSLAAILSAVEKNAWD